MARRLSQKPKRMQELHAAGSLVQKEIWVAENFKAFVLDAQKLGLPRAIGGVPKPARVRSSTWRDGIYEYDGDD